MYTQVPEHAGTVLGPQQMPTSECVGCLDFPWLLHPGLAPSFGGSVVSNYQAVIGGLE